jgi:hypothetical protein
LLELHLSLGKMLQLSHLVRQLCFSQAIIAYLILFLLFEFARFIVKNEGFAALIFGASSRPFHQGLEAVSTLSARDEAVHLRRSKVPGAREFCL